MSWIRHFVSSLSWNASLLIDDFQDFEQAESLNIKFVKRAYRDDVLPIQVYEVANFEW